MRLFVTCRTTKMIISPRDTRVKTLSTTRRPSQKHLLLAYQIPLRRITTQQRERAETESRYRAEKAHSEALGLPLSLPPDSTAGGILNRLRSASSTSRRRAHFPTPLDDHREEDRGHSVEFRPTLRPTWSSSSNTLATPNTDKVEGFKFDKNEGGPTDEKTRQEDAEMGTVEYVYPDGGYGWVVLVCCMSLAACTMG